MAGANLGHWISPTQNLNEEHLKNYITEFDIERAAKLGFDHLRLSVDYTFMEDDNNPGIYREDRVAYIDNTLARYKKYGLNLIIDLHKAPGIYYSDKEKNTLFTDPEKQDRFFAIWRFFATRYAGEGRNLAFELLNELYWSEGDPWNALWPKAAAIIHAVDPNRNIIIGGNRFNAVSELEYLIISLLDAIWYNFHFYDPMCLLIKRLRGVRRTAVIR